MKRRAEAVRQRDSCTTTRSSNDPMPDSGMDMNGIVTNEECERRVQSVLAEVGLTDRNHFVEARHGVR